MKTIKNILCLFCVVLIVSGCSSKSSNQKWVQDEMAGITDPGFTVVSKSKSSDEVKFQFKDVEVAAVNTFLATLYESDFKVSVNYNYEMNFYSYAAYNDAGESIHFTYDATNKTAVFIYGIKGNSVFVSGVRDVGYFIRANYDYAADDLGENYIASLWYTVNPGVKLTNQTDVILSCTVKNIRIKSGSRVGSLSIANDPYAAGTDNFTKTCTGYGDLQFVVRQKGIGSYPTTMDYSENKEAFFNAMGISQGDLNFVVQFTIEITTDKGTYTRDFEVKVMPDGNDTTKMGLTYDVDKTISDFSQGFPFTKQ